MVINEFALSREELDIPCVSHLIYQLTMFLTRWIVRQEGAQLREQRLSHYHMVWTLFIHICVSAYL